MRLLTALAELPDVLKKEAKSMMNYAQSVNLFAAPHVRASKLAVIAAACIVALGAISARGAEKAPKFSTLPPRTQLAYVNSFLRFEGATSLTAMLQTLAPEERAAAEPAFAEYREAKAARCQMLLGSAAVYLHLQPTAQSAESYWWSPAADAGVAFGWERMNGVWRLHWARWVSGPALRGENPQPLSTLPAWTVDRSPASALAAVALKTEAAVAAGALLRRPLAGDADDGGACARLSMARRSLDSGPAVQPESARATVKLFLAEENRTAGGEVFAAFRRTIAAYSPLERRMSAPLLAFGERNATVLWMSAGATGRAFLLHYNAAGAVEPSSIDTVVLAVGQGSK